MVAWLRRISPWMPVISLGIAAGLMIWGTVVGSPKPVLFYGSVYCGLVVFIESYWRAFPHRAVESHRLFMRAFYCANAFVMLANLSVDLLRESYVVDASWHDFSRRISGMLFGLAFAVWGNLLPKLASPWRFDEEPFDWSGVHRFNGWMFAIAGTVIFIGCLTLPLHDARQLEVVACLTAAVLGIGRKFYSLATWRAARRRHP